MIMMYILLIMQCRHVVVYYAIHMRTYVHVFAPSLGGINQLYIAITCIRMMRMISSNSAFTHYLI